MTPPPRLEGPAPVSGDGTISGTRGLSPRAPEVAAGPRHFPPTPHQAGALVHGKNSGEGGPDAARRARLILTHRVAGLAPAPGVPRAMLWNPAGASLNEAWDALGLSGGLLAVIGGTGPFGEFLPRYDAFHLSRAQGIRLPGGVPVFPGIPPASPEDLLASHGLESAPVHALDAAAGLILTVWRR